MNQDTLLEMEKVQEELSAAIRMTSIVADGMLSYTRNSSLSGANAETYVYTIQYICEMLSSTNEKLEEIFDCAAEAEKQKVRA